ncbi:MAG: archaemetzincin family Zn-dependent metalloprotease [Acidilobaceae archaeon]
MKFKVLIQPIESIDKQLLNWIREEIPKLVPVELEIRLSLWPLHIDYSRIFDWKRMQFKAVEVNRLLYKVYEDYLSDSRSYIVSVVLGDGYVEGLNFIFGLAMPELRVASVYTKRLETSDRGKFKLRVLKEVIHELGHLMGLGHCINPKCVMSFSNSIAEVDYKNVQFCRECEVKLKEYQHIAY